MMRTLERAMGLLVLVASGTYVFVYLYRWEWNRALLAGVVFLAAELGLGLSTLSDRIRGVERQLAGLRGRSRPSSYDATLDRLRETAPPPAEPFRWLRPDRGELGVFVPILLGAGVVASALAWLVERIAAHTSRPALERDLAGRLSALAWPDEPLAAAGPDWLAGPRP